MKGLFIHFFDFTLHSGISKKILSQVSALNELGHETHLCYVEICEDDTQKRVCNNTVIENFGSGVNAKILKWFKFKSLTKYIIENRYDFIYVRSFYNTTPSLLRMFKKLDNAGIKILLEFPTYPYKHEFDKIPLKNKFTFYFHQLYKHKLKKYISAIVTFSDFKNIYGVNTINISNGIDFSEVKLKTFKPFDQTPIVLIGVADIHYWHGFDRIIKGLASYYQSNNTPEVHFIIVGEGVEQDINALKDLVAKFNLEKYVTFQGSLYGQDLDNIFESAHFAIASLARHRSGITKIRTLKTREYAARGIPFIYSEIDEDFELMPYIMKATPNEAEIDIADILSFIQNNPIDPAQIRSSIENTLSWKIQMKKVIDRIK